jgi:hypothetical protein
MCRCDVVYSSGDREKKDQLTLTIEGKTVFLRPFGRERQALLSGINKGEYKPTTLIWKN